MSKGLVTAEIIEELKKIVGEKYVSIRIRINLTRTVMMK